MPRYDESAKDPYVDEETGILKNLPGCRTEDELSLKKESCPTFDRPSSGCIRSSLLSTSLISRQYTDICSRMFTVGLDDSVPSISQETRPYSLRIHELNPTPRPSSRSLQRNGIPLPLSTSRVGWRIISERSIQCIRSAKVMGGPNAFSLINSPRRMATQSFGRAVLNKR